MGEHTRRSDAVGAIASLSATSYINRTEGSGCELSGRVRGTGEATGKETVACYGVSHQRRYLVRCWTPRKSSRPRTSSANSLSRGLCEAVPSGDCAFNLVPKSTRRIEALPIQFAGFSIVNSQLRRKGARYTRLTLAARQYTCRHVTRMATTKQEGISGMGGNWNRP